MHLRRQLDEDGPELHSLKRTRHRHPRRQSHDVDVEHTRAARLHRTVYTPPHPLPNIPLPLSTHHTQTHLTVRHQQISTGQPISQVHTSAEPIWAPSDSFTSVAVPVVTVTKYTPPFMLMIGAGRLSLARAAEYVSLDQKTEHSTLSSGG